MLTAQVISQQNMQNENQNIVTMCHIKIVLKSSLLRLLLVTGC